MNNAESAEEVNALWKNVSYFLRPGGLFVGFGAFAPLAEHTVSSVKYGWKTSVLETNPLGIRGHVQSLTTPSIEHDFFALKRSVHEQAAERAGLSQLEYRECSADDVPLSNEHDIDWWRSFLDEPDVFVVTARRLLEPSKASGLDWTRGACCLGSMIPARQ